MLLLYRAIRRLARQRGTADGRGVDGGGVGDPDGAGRGHGRAVEGLQRHAGGVIPRRRNSTRRASDIWMFLPRAEDFIKKKKKKGRNRQNQRENAL